MNWNKGSPDQPTATSQAPTNNPLPRLQSTLPTSSDPTPSDSSDPSTVPDQYNQAYLLDTTTSSFYGHPSFNPYYFYTSQPNYGIPQSYYYIPQSQYDFRRASLPQYPYFHPAMLPSAHPAASFGSSSDAPLASSPNNIYRDPRLLISPNSQPSHQDSSSGSNLDSASQLEPATPSVPFQHSEVPVVLKPHFPPMHDGAGFTFYTTPASSPRPSYSSGNHYLPQQSLIHPSAMHFSQPAQTQPLLYHPQPQRLHVSPFLTSSPRTYEWQAQMAQQVQERRMEIFLATKQAEEAKRQEREQLKNTVEAQLHQRNLAVHAAASSSSAQHSSSSQQGQKQTFDDTRTLELRASRMNDMNTKNEATQTELEALGPSDRGKIGGFLLEMSYQVLRAYYIREKKNMTNEWRHSMFSYADMLRAYDGLGDYFLDVAKQRCIELAAEAHIPNLRDETFIRLDDETEEESAAKRVVKLKYQKTVEKLQNDQMPDKCRSGLLQEGIEILKNWFYDHYNFPYPTDEEKKQLCKEAKITMNQLSSWFLNHRKRVWKPSLSPDHPVYTGKGTKKLQRKAKQNKKKKNEGNSQADAKV